MRITTVIKTVLKERGIKKSELADMLCTTQGVVASRLNQENMSIKVALEMLRPLGYAIEVVPIKERVERSKAIGDRWAWDTFNLTMRDDEDLTDTEKIIAKARELMTPEELSVLDSLNAEGQLIMANLKLKA